MARGVFEKAGGQDTECAEEQPGGSAEGPDSGRLRRGRGAVFPAALETQETMKRTKVFAFLALSLACGAPAGAAPSPLPQPSASSGSNSDSGSSSQALDTDFLLLPA